MKILGLKQHLFYIILGLSVMASACGGAEKEEIAEHADAVSDELEANREQVSTHTFITEEVVDFSKQAPLPFHEQFARVVDAYLQLKNHLVAGDAEAAEEATIKLIAALEAAEAGILTGEAALFWEEKKKFLLEHAALSLQASTLEAKRENFAFLSPPMIKATDAFGVNRELFIDYCPMASDGKGAYWLSEIKEIHNPFFGEKMLKCGEVVKTL